MHTILCLMTTSLLGFIPLFVLAVRGYVLLAGDEQAGTSVPPNPWRLPLPGLAPGWRPLSRVLWRRIRYVTRCVERSLSALTMTWSSARFGGRRRAIVASECVNGLSHWALAGPLLLCAAWGTALPLPWFARVGSGFACALLTTAVAVDSRRTTRRRLQADALRQRRRAG